MGVLPEEDADPAHCALEVCRLPALQKALTCKMCVFCAFSRTLDTDFIDEHLLKCSFGLIISSNSWATNF